MTAIRNTRTVTIHNRSFAITGERPGDGRLSFTVDDLDCALPHPGDDLGERYRDAIKRRLAAVRRARAGDDG